MTDSPGQRIARELEEALNAGKGYDLIDAIDAAIDARTELMEAEARHAALVLVRRERAAAFTEAAALADIMHMTTPSNIASALRARAAEEAGNE